MAAPLQFGKQPNGVSVPLNVIGPHLQSSTLWSTWNPVNFSDGTLVGPAIAPPPPPFPVIPLDVAKLQQMPRSAQECEGFRLHAVRNDNGGSDIATTRCYEVAWSEAADFMQWCMGYEYSVQGPPTTTTAPGEGPGSIIVTVSKSFLLSRIPPAQDPKFPWLYAATCELETGKGAFVPDPQSFLTDANGIQLNVDGGVAVIGPSGALSSDPAVLPGSIYVEQPSPGVFWNGNANFRVTFRARPYPIRSDADAAKHPQKERCRHFSVQREYAVQALALNKLAAVGKLAFAVGTPFTGNAIPEGGVILMPTQTFKCTWHSVPFDPDPGIQACLGKVNNHPFVLAPGWGPPDGFDAQTLLCEAPESHLAERNAAGAPTWDVKFRLLYRPTGWNKFLGPDGQFWPAFLNGGTGNPIYALADFEQMWTPQPMPAWYR